MKQMNRKRTSAAGWNLADTPNTKTMKIKED